MLREAATLTNAIPCVYKRVFRGEEVAEQAWEVDRQLAKELLTSGMKVAFSADDDDLLEVQKDMLDFAHRVDPELAASLASLADTDPARVRARVVLQDHLGVLKATKQLANRPTSRDQEKSDEGNYPRAAWKLLGLLNAGQIEHRKQEDMREYAQIASRMPFSRAYPSLAWVIGNAVQRFANTGQAITVLRPSCEATLLASHIAARMADENKRIVQDGYIATEGSQLTQPETLVRSGQRDVALARVRRWSEEKVQAYLIVCDPFFGRVDVEVLTIVLAVKPELTVRILTSAKHQTQEQVPKPYNIAYMD
jgi:hypothetical protein